MDAETIKKLRDDGWFVGSMNDGLFIINRPPRPSNDEVWHDRPDGPDLVLNVTDLPLEKAQAICDAHNAALSTLNPGDADGWCPKCGAGPIGNCGFYGAETPRSMCPLPAPPVSSLREGEK